MNEEKSLKQIHFLGVGDPIHNMRKIKPLNTFYLMLYMYVVIIYFLPSLFKSDLHLYIPLLSLQLLLISVTGAGGFSLVRSLLYVYLLIYLSCLHLCFCLSVFPCPVHLPCHMSSKSLLSCLPLLLL